jgi:hypothetical protein
LNEEQTPLNLKMINEIALLKFRIFSFEKSSYQWIHVVHIFQILTHKNSKIFVKKPQKPPPWKFLVTIKLKNIKHECPETTRHHLNYDNLKYKTRYLFNSIQYWFNTILRRSSNIFIRFDIIIWVKSLFFHSILHMLKNGCSWVDQ